VETSQCGTEGNERADISAQKGTIIKQQHSIPFHFLNVIIQNNIKKEREVGFERSINKKWNILIHNNKVIPQLPRKASVAYFGLYTGHICLASHLCRLSILPHHHSILCKDPSSTPLSRHFQNQLRHKFTISQILLGHKKANAGDPRSLALATNQHCVCFLRCATM
jgi:hypothetical protein